MPRVRRRAARSATQRRAPYSVTVEAAVIISEERGDILKVVIARSGRPLDEALAYYLHDGGLWDRYITNHAQGDFGGVSSANEHFFNVAPYSVTYQEEAVNVNA